MGRGEDPPRAWCAPAAAVALSAIPGGLRAPLESKPSRVRRFAVRLRRRASGLRVPGPLEPPPILKAPCGSRVASAHLYVSSPGTLLRVSSGFGRAGAPFEDLTAGDALEGCLSCDAWLFALAIWRVGPIRARGNARTSLTQYRHSPAAKGARRSTVAAGVNRSASRPACATSVCDAQELRGRRSPGHDALAKKSPYEMPSTPPSRLWHASHPRSRWGIRA